MAEPAAARLDIYWSFRSPYSWLATARLGEIARDYAVDAHLRFVRPLAMREGDFFEKARPQWMPYLFKDVFREAERLGVPFMPPRPDPIVMDFATGKVAAEQPYLPRLMDLGVAAELGSRRGLAFAQAVAARVWGGVENWNAPAHLAAAASQAGLDIAGLDAFIAANREAIGVSVAENEAAQLEHHWGVPLMVLDGEPFFGQDRLDSLVWRLDRRGLRR